MVSSVMDASCGEFAASLASASPVPGGGSASAYTGALSAALCSMVGNFTVGKKAYAPVEDDMRRILGEAEEVRARLLQLADEDARAFEPLSRAYGISKDDPGRADALETAAKAACIPPLEMMRCICSSIDLLDEMGAKGSRMLMSDVGCGALLARAALEAASLNVFVNTGGLRDRGYAEKVEAECDGMFAEYRSRAEELAARMMDKVRG